MLHLYGITERVRASCTRGIMFWQTSGGSSQCKEARDKLTLETSVIALKVCLFSQPVSEPRST